MRFLLYHVCSSSVKKWKRSACLSSLCFWLVHVVKKKMKSAHLMMNLKIALTKNVHRNLKKSPACRMLNKAIIDDFQIEDRKNKNSTFLQWCNSADGNKFNMLLAWQNQFIERRQHVMISLQLDASFSSNYLIGTFGTDSIKICPEIFLPKG